MTAQVHRDSGDQVALALSSLTVGAVGPRTLLIFDPLRSSPVSYGIMMLNTLTANACGNCAYNFPNCMKQEDSMSIIFRHKQILIGLWLISACGSDPGSSYDESEIPPTGGDAAPISQIDCAAALQARNVQFVFPSNPPSTIKTPVTISSINGVQLRYVESASYGTLMTSCNGAISLADTANCFTGTSPLRSIVHIGSYNYRTIGTSNVLSSHAYALAIDIAGFEYADGTRNVLPADWNINAKTLTAGAKKIDTLLRGAFSQVLGPEYNPDHYNHWHAEDTIGSIIPSQIPCRNIVANGDFSNQMDKWAVEIHQYGSANIVLDYSKYASKPPSIRFDNSWIQLDYQVQINQSNIQISSGNCYKLSYWGASASPRTIQVSLHKGSPNWDNYGLYTEVALPQFFQRIEHYFTAKISATDARLAFMGGKSSSSVWIDDVVLENLGKRTSCP